MKLQQAIEYAKLILDNLVLYPAKGEHQNGQNYKDDVAYLADTLIDLSE